ncbi:hypothetical protein BX616_006629 [Lobosporangium transversale]|nr:hypothetical protein BX616_006629 [Lobosporangium transversale]
MYSPFNLLRYAIAPIVVLLCVMGTMTNTSFAISLSFEAISNESQLECSRGSQHLNGSKDVSASLEKRFDDKEGYREHWCHIHCWERRYIRAGGSFYGPNGYDVYNPTANYPSRGREISGEGVGQVGPYNDDCWELCGAPPPWYWSEANISSQTAGFLARWSVMALGMLLLVFWQNMF